jgi:hypothetical protein
MNESNSKPLSPEALKAVREALEFYAEEKTWLGLLDVDGYPMECLTDEDEGEIARKALTLLGGEQPEPAAPANCETCDDTGEAMTMRCEGGPPYEFMEPCPDCPEPAAPQGEDAKIEPELQDVNEWVDAIGDLKAKHRDELARLRGKTSVQVLRFQEERDAALAEADRLRHMLTAAPSGAPEDMAEVANAIIGCGYGSTQLELAALATRIRAHRCNEQ